MKLCFLHRTLQILPLYIPSFFKTIVSITVWLVFPSEKVSSHPSHDLEQLYKHPSFDYTWSYKKKTNLNWTHSRWLYAGISTVQKWQPLKKIKIKKTNILQELANKNSIKCLSHCYCGMSMEFCVVLEVMMTGGKTTRRHHCSQIRLVILN